MKEEKTKKRNQKQKKNSEEKQDGKLKAFISNIRDNFFDIPNEAQSYVFTRSILCIAVIIAFIVFAIAARNPKFLLGILAALAIWAYAMSQKVLPFFTENVVFFDGVIVEQAAREVSIPMGKLAKQAVSGSGHYLMVRHDSDVYKITIPHFREEYCPGGNVRVYFRRGERYERNPNFFAILEPMYIVLQRTTAH